MDINEQIKQATDIVIAEKLPAMVTDQVTKMLDKVLQEVFSQYAPMSKQIKEKIEAQLDINLQRFALADYNVMVSNAINQRLVGIVNDQAIQPIMQLVKDSVGFLERKTIKITEIHEMVKEGAREEAVGGKYEGEFSFHVNDDEKWHSVSFDLDENIAADRCKISFLVNKTHHTIFCFKAGNYMQTKELITPARLTMLSTLEHKIFRLYAAQVKVEVDKDYFDESDNYWSEQGR